MEVSASPFAGVILHAIGGLAAASFYIPYKRVKGWAWENAWILGGFFSWVVAPLVAATILAPAFWEVLQSSPVGSLVWSWVFGFLWGIGALTYGLTMRYLGIALGNALALGLCAFFGTIIPPIFDGQIGSILTTFSGQVTLSGLAVCLIGIAMSGRAGWKRESELGEEEKRKSSNEFNFGKGLVVAVFTGVMSACMAFGFAAGKPIAEQSIEAGISPLWQNLPVLVVVLCGGFTMNFIWCLGLIIKRRNLGAYAGRAKAAEEMPRGWKANYLWCALAGLVWYLQFFFYGMGATKMGTYEFSSWTLHMASIIIFSTLWGIALKEWKGTSPATHRWIAAGLALLILSTAIVGWGNSMAASPAAGH